MKISRRCGLSHTKRKTINDSELIYASTEEWDWNEIVSYELTCLNKLPFGVLQIKLRFLHDGGSITDPKTQKTRNYPMQPHSKFILIEFNGVPVCSSINSSLYPFFGETTLSVPISIEAKLMLRKILKCKAYTNNEKEEMKVWISLTWNSWKDI